MKILGIESSCDETAIAIYDSEQGLLAHMLHSQAALHSDYGGVVPELAARDHIRRLIPLMKKTLSNSNCNIQDIDGVAYTTGPGLMGSLLVGACFGESLAWSLSIPSIPVHHMEAHLLAPLLEDPEIRLPFVALLVSGGHTLLVEVKKIGKYKILGESLDDAVGEAFDKTAKILGLRYPGGPELAALATKGKTGVYKFPRPMTKKPGFDFSFSGLKTYTLNEWQKSKKTDQVRANIALAFEDAAVETLILKAIAAMKITNTRDFILAGGVAANSKLRNLIKKEADKISVKVHFPSIEYCTDNAAMIAYTGYLRFESCKKITREVVCRPRWSLEELND